MYQLYCVLKDREEPPTPDEIAITSGKKQLDGRTEAEYLKRLEKASENIKKAFEDQQAQAAVSDSIFLTRTPHWLINRGRGTRKNSSNILPNGLLRVTSPLMRSKNLSLSWWWTSHITLVVHWRFHDATRSSSVSWKWARKQLKVYAKCSRYSYLMVLISPSHLINYESRILKEKLAYHLMRGHRATSMPS